ncbi:MAG: MFS transporter [Acidimicrobiia bacterium]
MERLRNDRRTIFGWAMYDWANSAYITTFGAVTAAFFTDEIVPESGYDLFGWNVGGQTLWALVVSIGAAALFLGMPVLGAIADFSGAKRRFLRTAALAGAAVTMLVAFVPAGSVTLFLLLALVTQIGFVASNVFYDAFLPAISTDETIDRVSSRGFAFGYVGGGLYLVLVLVVVLLSGDDSVTGFSEDTAFRIGIAGSGVWWAGFTLFALSRLPEPGQAQPLPAAYAGRRRSRAYVELGFRRTIDTGRKLLGFRQLMLFVVAFIFYNDGTQTVIAISGAYAEDTLNLEVETIAVAFLIVQFVAFGGALLFGALADRAGAKKAIMGSLIVWSLLAIVAFFLPEGRALPFFGLAAVVGVVLGGVQALSRSLYGTMIPEEASAEFFGFFSVFSKFSAIWGPLVFALVSGIMDSGRPAIVSIVFFFVVGFVLLARVDVDEARASRQRWDFADSA